MKSIIEKIEKFEASSKDSAIETMIFTPSFFYIVEDHKVVSGTADQELATYFNDKLIRPAKGQDITSSYIDGRHCHIHWDDHPAVGFKAILYRNSGGWVNNREQFDSVVSQDFIELINRRMSKLNELIPMYANLSFGDVVSLEQIITDNLNFDSSLADIKKQMTGILPQGNNDLLEVMFHKFCEGGVLVSLMACEDISSFTIKNEKIAITDNEGNVFVFPYLFMSVRELYNFVSYFCAHFQMRFHHNEDIFGIGIKSLGRLEVNMNQVIHSSFIRFVREK